MKKSLALLVLLGCLVLPAQIASAFSFDMSKSLEQNFQALAAESGNRFTDMGSTTFNPGAGNYFNLVMVYLDESLNVDPFGGAAQDLNGLSALMSMEYGDFVINLASGSATLNDRVSVKWLFPTGGNDMVFEYNSGTITVTGGAIFAVDLTGDGNYNDAIFVLAPGDAPTATPLPGAALLLGTGALGLLGIRRKV